MPTSSGDIIRVSARQLYDNVDEVVNVFHFTVQTAPAGGDPDLLTDIGSFMSTAWLAIDEDIPNNQTPNVIDVYNVSDDYPVGQTPWGGAYIGGLSAGENLPNQDALLVLWLTATKRVQGKTYLGVMIEGNLVDGRWGGNVVGRVGTWATNMRSEVALTGGTALRLGIWSRGAGQMRPITGRRIVVVPATQRRRRVGRGS